MRCFAAGTSTMRLTRMTCPLSTTDPTRPRKIYPQLGGRRWLGLRLGFRRLLRERTLRRLLRRASTDCAAGASPSAAVEAQPRRAPARTCAEAASELSVAASSGVGLQLGGAGLSRLRRPSPRPRCGFGCVSGFCASDPVEPSAAAGVPSAGAAAAGSPPQAPALRPPGSGTTGTLWGSNTSTNAVALPNRSTENVPSPIFATRPATTSPAAKAWRLPPAEPSKKRANTPPSRERSCFSAWCAFAPSAVRLPHLGLEPGQASCGVDAGASFLAGSPAASAAAPRPRLRPTCRSSSDVIAFSRRLARLSGRRHRRRSLGLGLIRVGAWGAFARLRSLGGFNRGRGSLGCFCWSVMTYLTAAKLELAGHGHYAPSPHFVKPRRHLACAGSAFRGAKTPISSPPRPPGR